MSAPLRAPTEVPATASIFTPASRSAFQAPIWYAPFAPSLYEGFQAGQAYFGDYLNRKKPYRWYHYFQFHYWKQLVKRLLKK